MSAPMITFVPTLKKLYRYAASWTTGSYATFDLAPVQVHDVGRLPEKSSRTLKHLIKANHINHSIFYHNLEFHNHTVHILCSAYLLGAHEDQLHCIYDEEAKVLEEWVDSPSEITEHDWRLYLGKHEFQRAFLDFFEDELALKHEYDWKTVAREFLFDGKNPLINCAVSGVGHGLIHLGYAFEMDNREIGMEALAMLASGYSYLHKYLDDPSYTKPSENPSTSLLQLLERIRTDKRIDDMSSTPGPSNIHTLFTEHEDIVMEYWNSWQITDPLKQFEESQLAAVALLTSTVSPSSPEYDFFLCHVLTTSHAARILLPSVPPKFHMSVVRQWWLLTIAVYISQARPVFDTEKVFKPVGDKMWKYVEHKALTGKWRTDAHYVKALRAMKEAAATWGDVDEKYLRQAVWFADSFDGWHGFGH